MRTRASTTQAWLLQKVPLANDDTLLTFLTKDLGKIKVFATKLQRSKKKVAELDYFRWLELELAQPKQSFKLKNVRTLTDFSPYMVDYYRLELGFEALENTARFCPEEKAMPDIVQLLHELLTLKSLPLTHLSVYFNTKLLWFSGVLPRFDTLRGDVWVDPSTLIFTSTPQTEGLALSNHQRQLLEWFRRCEAKDLLDKYEDFAEHDLAILQAFLNAVIKNH
jgi:recombinational DNA repair protein (RecF pathway)